MTAPSTGILWFKNVTKEDAHNASELGIKLGEMLQAGFPLPNGFIVTSRAYFHFLHENRLMPKINNLLATLNYEHPDSLMQVSAHIKKIINETGISDAFMKELTTAYNTLNGVFKNGEVSVQTSDPGQSVHHVHGEANLIIQVKRAWASCFDPSVMLDNYEKKRDHFQKGIAVVIKKEILAEKSGLLLTADPVTNDKSKVIIEANNMTDDQINELTTLGEKLQKYFYFPQEISWAIERDTLFIIETKPLNIHDHSQITSSIAAKLPLLLKTTPVSRGIASGSLTIIQSEKDLEKVLLGDVLLIKQPNITYKNALKKASALIINSGGRTSHAALFARELGIPAVIATNFSEAKFQHKQIITVDGTAGKIYKGSTHNLAHVANSTATQIYVTLSDSSAIENISKEHINGVGPVLAEQLTATNDKAPRKLAEELSLICKTFQSQPVIYRTSDILPDDTNPLLGFRGTSSYIHSPKHFKFELEAIKYARTALDCKNLGVMLPFVRSVRELVTAKQMMSEFGLSRTNTFKIWMSISLPSNIILINEFIAAGLDGVALHVDELAMLMLGVDRENSEIAHAYDVLDPSVLWAIEQVIKAANKHKITSSIYGHALSYHSSLIEKLVHWGITTISVTPEAIDATRERVSQAERKLIENR